MEEGHTDIEGIMSICCHQKRDRLKNETSGWKAVWGGRSFGGLWKAQRQPGMRVLEPGVG